jgi:hypothetical protein
MISTTAAHPLSSTTYSLASVLRNNTKATQTSKYKLIIALTSSRKRIIYHRWMRHVYSGSCICNFLPITDSGLWDLHSSITTIQSSIWITRELGSLSHLFQHSLTVLWIQDSFMRLSLKHWSRL